MRYFQLQEVSQWIQASLQMSLTLASKLNDPQDDHCIIEPIQPFTAFLEQSNIISSIYLPGCTSYEISEPIRGLDIGK